MCEELLTNSSGGNNNGQGCYYYCVAGTERILVYCPGGTYSYEYYSSSCGDRVVNCPEDCEWKPFENYFTEECYCPWGYCPIGYDKNDSDTIYYTHTWCDVCPLLHQ
jgi:hypothetical protein